VTCEAHNYCDTFVLLPRLPRLGNRSHIASCLEVDSGDLKASEKRAAAPVGWSGTDDASISPFFDHHLLRLDLWLPVTQLIS
jgi:hypothetical protein